MAEIRIQHSEPLASTPAQSRSWRTFWQHALSPAAARAYHALRQADGATLDSLDFAGSLGLTEPQLTRALTELRDRGFIEVRPGP